ncbi:DUF4239 domain-containing protein [Accumulibacter sp.]|uniref:bestrophin-like domain n=1 Tax=Accumulibacter sp. TaxID=2053492 RepID=UPI002D07058C|nr:DUF4239 domain-containing protein [Accumulibacter sp.]HRF07009.1 DUF4239 domain-containing protein [Accumulibacter sp.]
MGYTAFASLITFVLFVGMVALLEIGRRIGVRERTNDPEGAHAGTGALDGAVFALLGLLIAFTFSGAAARFDERRNLIVQEANDIGTAYLRLDLLPHAAQPALRDQFRRYVGSRLEVYRKLPDIEAAKAELAVSIKLQGEIWSQALAASQMNDAPPAAAMLLLPALNQMIDITTTRTTAAAMHPPVVIFVLLYVLALIAALLAGYGMSAAKSRSWLHMIGFAATMALAVYVVIDIEYPRLGLIRVDTFDEVLVDVLESMKQSR